LFKRFGGSIFAPKLLFLLWLKPVEHKAGFSDKSNVKQKTTRCAGNVANLRKTTKVSNKKR
jgi:hypothetical protein